MSADDDFATKFERLHGKVGTKVVPMKRVSGRSGRASSSIDDPDLEAMNKKFAVVKVGGRTRVMSLEESPIYSGWRVPVFATFADFRHFYHRRKLDGGREVGIGSWWLAQEARRQYAGVIYA